MASRFEGNYEGNLGMPRLTHLAPLACLGLAVSASGQQPADVLRFFNSGCNVFVEVMDGNQSLVHTWNSGFRPFLGIELRPNGNMLRMIRDTEGGGEPEWRIQEHAFDSTMLWDYATDTGRLMHHDLEALPNGNVLILAREISPISDAIANGRDPAKIGTPPALTWSPETIIEVQRTGPTTGVVVWEWRVMDHLVQDFDSSKPNFGVVANHPELLDINFPDELLQLTTTEIEFNHCNSLDYDPDKDWILISSPVQDEIWVIDHSTTTAEAAGHTGGRWGKGGDFLYRWGNPQSYRAGLEKDRMLGFQHSAEFVLPGYPGEGNVTIFNNQFPWLQSRVDEIVLPVDASGQFILGPGGRYGPAAPVWSYAPPGLFSQVMSSAERLPNGNTLINSATQSRVFEVTPSGQVVWDHTTRCRYFHARHTTRSLWADPQALSASAGGSVSFNMLLGTQWAGDLYVLLGSVSGTSPGFNVQGIQVPLNPDGYTFGLFGLVGTGVFTNWVGTFDALGRASASFPLPPIPPLAGLTMHHAFIVADGTTGMWTRASNAVPLVFNP